MAIRFHLDEHVDDAVAQALRRRGIDVTTTRGGLAFRGGRGPHRVCADTAPGDLHTRDFLRLAASGVEHAGIVYSRAGSRTVGEVIEYLVLMHACIGEEEMANHIEFL